MINIIIVDDHRMFRESIRKILTIDKIAKVQAEAGNGQEFLNLLENFTPDLVLMDISMPVMDGIEATKKALERLPDLKILTLSSFGNEKYYFDMVEAGTKGFILKNAGIVELKKAIQEVADGGSWFSSELLHRVISTMNTKTKVSIQVDFSERELEIIKLICESLTNEQIAEKINLSVDTIKWHRANIMEKSRCTNVVGLVMYAIKNKIIEI